MTAPLHAFCTELLFYSVTTAGLLWLPFHFGRKMRKRRPLTRRNYIEMSLGCAFMLLMMNIENLPPLIRTFKAVDWQHFFSLVFGTAAG